MPDSATPLIVDGETVPDSERQPCEVWSRVMGYLRPVTAWNRGKKQEQRDRVYYSQALAMAARQMQGGEG